MALTILSGIEADEFALCVQEGDSARLVKLPGVGKKTAERLIMEMRDRLSDWETSGAAEPASRTGATRDDSMSEAVSALIALGYKPQEASRYVHTVAAENLSSEEIIREALKASIK
jgi:Holliday junction DNA helicase RuvA